MGSKRFHFARCVYTMLDGAARLLDVGGVNDKGPHVLGSDAEAIARDWVMVGRDFRKALRRAEESEPEHRER